MAKNSKSFTLIETIVAISIFILGVLSVISYIQFSLKVLIRQQDSIIIQSLAQEGIEAARNFRDTNYLNGRLYDYNLSGSVSLFFNGIAFYTLDTFSDIPLRVCQSGLVKYYGCKTGGVETKFHRRLIFEKAPSGSGEYIKVISEVSSKPFSKGNGYILEDRLYNWYGP